MTIVWALVAGLSVQGEAPVGYAAQGPARSRPASRYRQEVQCNWDQETLQNVANMVAEFTGRVIFWSPEAAPMAMVTMITHRGGLRTYSEEEYWELFLQVLQALPQPIIAIRLPGFPRDEEEYMLRQRGDAALRTHPIYVYARDEDPPQDAAIYAKIFKLNHILGADAANFVRTRFVGMGLETVVTDMVTNEGQALYVVDSGHNLRRLRDMLAEIDVPMPELRIEVVPITYNLAVDVKERMQPILDIYKSRAAQGTAATGRPATPQPGQPGQPTQPGQAAGAREEVINVEVEPRQNALIVMTESAQREEELLNAIRLLDQRPRALLQYYVRPIRHIKPSQMAQIINATIESGEAKTIEREEPQMPVLPSVTGPTQPTTYPTTPTTPPPNVPGWPPRGFPARLQEGTTGPTTQEDQRRLPRIGPVPPEIVADDNTGNLVILADPETMAMIDRVIEQMDRRRPQILLRAHIVEVSADDDFDLGVTLQRLQRPSRGHFALNAGTQTGGVPPEPVLDPTDPTRVVGVSFPAPGLTVALLRDSVFNIVALLNASEGVGRARVLQEPEIFVRDGMTGMINLSLVEWFLRQAPAVPGQPPQAPNADSAQATTTLQITPRITEHASIDLTIGIQSSDFVGDRQQFLPRDTVTRQVTSIVTVPNGFTAVLGGFRLERHGESSNGVPFLKDIPLLGRLFRRDAHSSNKDVLYFFITATILEEVSFGDLRHETDLRRGQIEDLRGEPMERVLTDIPPPPQPVEGDDRVPVPHSPYRRPGPGPRR